MWSYFRYKNYLYYGELLVASLLCLWIQWPVQGQPIAFTTAQVQASPPPTIDDPFEYVLGPGDQVAISVIGYEEFSGTRVVLPDGSIAIPLLGSVQVATKTTDQVSRELTFSLQQYLVNPVVTVSLSILRPVTVTVSGEVYRPGLIQLSSLTNVSQQLGTDSNITSSTSTPTLSRALAAAGGVKRTANIRQVTVRRTLPSGAIEIIDINLWEALTFESVVTDPLLRDGDAVYVPEIIRGDQLDQRLLASSTFAPSEVRVRVVGEVNRPGEVSIPPDSSLSSAVAIAGGPTDDARLRSVALIRLDASGEVQEEVIDLRNLVDNVQIQDGDVIWVPKQEHLGFLDTIGRVLPTPLNIINLLQNIGILD